MPIDPVIAYGIRPPQIEAPGAISARVLSLRGMVQQQQIAEQMRQQNQAKLDEYQRQVAGDKTLADAVRQFTNDKGETDYGSVKKRLAEGGYGSRVSAIDTAQRTAEKAQLDNRKLQLENAKAQHAQITNALNAVTQAPEDQKQAVHTAALDYLLQAKLIEPGDLPAVYDPAKHAAAVAAGQEAKDQITAAQSALDFGLRKADSEASRPGKVAESQTKVVTAQQMQETGMTKKDAVTVNATAARDAAQATYQSGQLKQGERRLGLEGQRVGLEGQRVGLEARRVANDERVLNQFGSTAQGGPALTGDAYLKTLPPPVAAQVKAIAEGRQTSLPRGKELMPLMNAVNQYDPTYTAQRAKIRGAFMTGPDGRNIGALNTAVVHLDQMHEAAKAMKNGNWQPGNALYNYIAEKFGAEAPTNYAFVMNALSGEAATALKGNATDPEIAHMISTFKPNMGPDQAEGVALAGLHVFAAKFNTYDERYHALMPDDPWSPVLPSAKKVFDRYKINPLDRTSSGGGHAAGGAAAGGGVVVVDPNGGKHTFPNQAAADKFKSLAGIK
jgi:hypothetical protein